MSDSNQNKAGTASPRFPFPYKIFVNQMGYMPQSEKRATLTMPADSFTVEDTKGNVFYKGKVAAFGEDEHSGDITAFADFSELTTPGTYIMKTDTGLTSIPFTIGQKVYNNTLWDTMKAFYMLRCGSGLTPEHAGIYHHGPCHTGKAVLWDDHSVSMEVTGGWHDAGDYGRYTTAGACALAHLLYAFRFYPQTLGTMDLNIPESGQALPDVLAECKWELDFFLKLQREDGAVYHKVTTARHAPFIMPELDLEQLYVLPVSSMACADFAAVCALASGIFAPYDAAYAQKLKDAAILTGKWLMDNPDFIPFKNPPGCGTGWYGEWSDVDNRFWAYCELYALTGDPVYHEKLKGQLETSFSHIGLGYSDMGGLGALAYLNCNREDADPALKEMFIKEFIEKAEELTKLSESCGYGVSMQDGEYCWGSNMHVMKNAMYYIIADRLEGGKRFHRYVERQVHYLLGVNATGYSFITGNGAYAYNYPHLRPADQDGIEACMPGMVSGGPNRGLQDPKAKELVPEGTPPMKCFADHMACYSLNEITIYWNSPTVFALAYLCEK